MNQQYTLTADLARKITQEANLPGSSYVVSEVNNILASIRLRADAGEDLIYLRFPVKDIIKSQLREIGYVVSDGTSQATIIKWN